jgi:hypothetical protein
VSFNNRNTLQARFSRRVSGLFVIKEGVRLHQCPAAMVSALIAAFINARSDFLLQPRGHVLCATEDGAMRWIDIQMD